MFTLENVPKERIKPSTSCVENPMKDTETLYGPPIRIPGIEYLPSTLDTAP